MTHRWISAGCLIALAAFAWFWFARASDDDAETIPPTITSRGPVSTGGEQPAELEASPHDPAAASGQERVDLPTTDGNANPVPGDSAATTTLAVRVERFDGQPIEDATVFVLRRATADTANTPSTAEQEERLRPTDSAGNTALSLSAAEVERDILRLRAQYRDLFRGSIEELRISAITDSPLVVRMPLSGEIRLHLRTAPGVDPATLETTPAWISPWIEGRAGGSQGMRIDESRIAHSGPLPLGQRYRVAIDEPRMAKVVDGPVFAGEVVRVEFEIGADRILLTGRILGTDGVPLRSAVLRLSGHRSLGIQGVRCQPDGSFSLVLDSNAVGSELTASIEYGGNGRPMAGAHARIPALAIGRNDIGTVRLAAVDAIAQGIVVDTQGTPVNAAVVSLLTWIPPTSATSRTLWFQTMRVARTQRDGSFILDGPIPTGRLALAVTPDPGPGNFLLGSVDDPVEITAPARELRLVLEDKRPRRR